MSPDILLYRQDGILIREDDIYYTDASGDPVLPPPIEPTDEFVLGVTKPTLANTGFRVPEGSLSNYNGSFTNLQANEIVSGLAISQIIDVGTGDGPGTFRDCLVKYGQPPTWPSSATVANTWPGVKGWGNHNGVKFEHCEFRPNPSFLSHDIYGPQGGGRVSVNAAFDFYRCKIKDVVDGIVPHGASGVRKQVKILGCHITGIRYYNPDPRQGPEGAHPDGIQVQGNMTNVEIVGNYVEGGGTSVLLFGNNVPGGYTDVVVRDNWFLGDASQGSTINWSAEHSATNPMVRVSVFRNRISVGGNTPGILVRQSVRNLATTNLGLSNGGTGTPIVGSANGNDYQCNVQMHATTHAILRDGSGFVLPYTVTNG